MADPIKPTAADSDLAGWFERRMGPEWKGRTANLVALHAQQAREQALEEAAKVADRTYISDAFRFELGKEVAANIRALKEQRP